MGAYVRRNSVSIFRIYAQYEPLRVFWTAGAVVGLLALGVWARFLVFWLQGEGAGHVQSLILGSVLFTGTMLLFALGVIGDLLAAQRTLSQRTFERVRRIELQLGIPPSHYEPGAPRPTEGDAAADASGSTGESGETGERKAVEV
jgi:hypothetical protein